MWMNLRTTRLAVLSACETGMTPVRDPTQEFAGLFTAFLTAGVPTVLASLWPVDDVSTALLMHRFYQHHLGDPRENIPSHPPADALCAAQKWLRALKPKDLGLPSNNPTWQYLLGHATGDRPFANPYFWAGFVLAGG